ncbi:acyl-CoA thioesterase II [Sphingomonas sp. PL-96]|uniref:acyl-CoA thioesterase n=1 Tax=Sphingomonas sp. PL-96 TaxID=2887201 RepID=UPI001E3064FA|nr:acyl-CoA thioesterase II [Sphingomonas sp. PL-96]MCC2975793.1 acyl-CoA thioesterase II [Sphingomonas sp. PL-96]
MAHTPELLVETLVTLLDLEALDTDLYRGARLPGGKGRVFGGQVIGQALQAAQRSVEGKVAHSLHAYFMRAGNAEQPIVFQVTRDFDGRSFATRRVMALQGGQPMLVLAASFQHEEEGLHHQDAMPDVPPPEALGSEAEVQAQMGNELSDPVRRFLAQPRPIEMRPVAPGDWLRSEPRPPVQHSWFRTVAALPDDPMLHRAVLAYASDMLLLGTSMMPHSVRLGDPRMQTASLDHALWLHEPFRFDDWLLYTTDSPWAGNGRGFNRGRIFTRDGRLVASVAQEGLIRKRG